MKVLYLTKGFIHPDLKCKNIVYDYLCKHFWQKVDRKSLAYIGALELDSYDIIIIYFHIKKENQKNISLLDDYVKNGGKLIGIHGVAASYKENKKWFHLLGGKFVSHPPIGEISVTYNKENYIIEDELYVFKTKGIETIMWARINQMQQPCGWIKKHEDGCVYYLSLGHRAKAFKMILLNIY